MKMWVLSVLAVLGLSVGHAQESYFGIGVALVNGTIPLPGVQVGGHVAEGLELRGTLDSVVLISDLGLDLLYTLTLPDAPLELYLGGGPDIAGVFVGGGGPFFAVHATAGLEYPLEGAGLFAEMQPIFLFTGDGPGPLLTKLRAGVNFYF